MWSLLCSIFNETWIYFRQVFGKFSDIKFYENSSNGSRSVTCKQTDRRTDMTKVLAPLRNSAKAPNYQIFNAVENSLCLSEDRNKNRNIL